MPALSSFKRSEAMPTQAEYAARIAAWFAAYDRAMATPVKIKD